MGLIEVAQHRNENISDMKTAEERNYVTYKRNVTEVRLIFHVQHVGEVGGRCRNKTSFIRGECVPSPQAYSAVAATRRGSLMTCWLAKLEVADRNLGLGGCISQRNAKKKKKKKKKKTVRLNLGVRQRTPGGQTCSGALHHGASLTITSRFDKPLECLDVLLTCGNSVYKKSFNDYTSHKSAYFDLTEFRYK